MAKSWSLQEDSILENNQLDDNWCQGTLGLLSLYHFRYVYITYSLIGSLQDPIQFIYICTATRFCTHCVHSYINKIVSLCKGVHVNSIYVFMSPRQCIELDWVVRSQNYGLTVLVDMKVILCVWYYYSLTWTDVLCFSLF